MISALKKMGWAYLAFYIAVVVPLCLVLFFFGLLMIVGMFV